MKTKKILKNLGPCDLFKEKKTFTRMSTLFKIQIIDSFVPIFKIGKKYEVPMYYTALHPTNWNQKVAQQKNNFFPSKTFKNQI